MVEIIKQADAFFVLFIYGVKNVIGNKRLDDFLTRKLSWNILRTAIKLHLFGFK